VIFFFKINVILKIIIDFFPYSIHDLRKKKKQKNKKNKTKIQNKTKGIDPFLKSMRIGQINNTIYQNNRYSQRRPSK
jgi:hypothetical protein